VIEPPLCVTGSLKRRSPRRRLRPRRRQRVIVPLQSNVMAPSACTSVVIVIVEALLTMEISAPVRSRGGVPRRYCAAR
jgi:hypothetical protein